MSYEIDFTEQAQTEANDAFEWIVQYSPEKATLWYFDLMERVGSLGNFPGRCALAPESYEFAEEIRQLLYDKYRILFVIEDEVVRILHIRHSARKTLSPEDE